MALKTRHKTPARLSEAKTSYRRSELSNNLYLKSLTLDTSLISYSLTHSLAHFHKYNYIYHSAMLHDAPTDAALVRIPQTHAGISAALIN